MIKRGQKCWIILNNSQICPVTVKSISGNLYTIMLESGGAIRLPRHRLYASFEDAEQYLKSLKKFIPLRLHMIICKNSPPENRGTFYLLLVKPFLEFSDTCRWIAKASVLSAS